jgi:hypothetical protein
MSVTVKDGIPQATDLAGSQIRHQEPSATPERVLAVDDRDTAGRDEAGCASTGRVAQVRAVVLWSEQGFEAEVPFVLRNKASVISSSAARNR